MYAWTNAVEVLKDQPTFSFCCDELADGGGYTWTLPSLLGAWLAEAERRYGERNKNYTILGVEIGPRERPQVWYPGNRQHILIQLSAKAAVDRNWALFDLSQEIVHLLAPSGGKNANLFEEGVATLFQCDVCEQAGVKVNGVSVRKAVENGAKSSKVTREYFEALQLIERLLKQFPNCIWSMRREQANFYEFTPNLILEHAPGFDPIQAARLCQRFT